MTDTPRKFPKGVERAWYHYQDLYDRHMALLRDIGGAQDIEDIQSKYDSQILHALNEWSTPQERFEMGGYDDFDLGM